MGVRVRSRLIPWRVFLLSTFASTWIVPAHADTPLGWINTNNPSAYTTTQGELEIAVAKLAVNDTLDFLNYREDLIATSGRLTGDSGNLEGTQFELNYGLTRELSVFYHRQQHSLTLDLGEISSVDLVDIDKSLDTTVESAGFKWTFYRGNLLNPDNRHSAASLELTAFANHSSDFDLVVDEIRLDNLTVIFRDPQTFSVSDMQDDGWKARMLYTWPVGWLGTATIWAGYGESSATSSTTSDITSATVRNFFEQDFQNEETYLYAGGSINWNLTPRLPISLNYEYIRVNDSNFTRAPDPPRDGLPGFLAQSPIVEAGNHTLAAQISYWLTPRIYLKLSGNLYSNQFLGILPHYSNPLSGSFVDKPYGFAGLALGFNY